MAQQEKSPVEGSPGLLKSASAGESSPLSFRCLLMSKEAGTIIGRGGSAIAELRRASGCRINISDSGVPDEERILAVTGDAAAVSQVFASVCTSLAEQRPDQPLSLRLVIPNAQAGAVIGKQGKRIGEIRENSGAEVILEKNLLPASTERLCIVSGSLAVVTVAVLSILDAIRETPGTGLEANVPYQPGKALVRSPVHPAAPVPPPHHLQHMHPLHPYTHQPHIASPTAAAFAVYSPDMLPPAYQEILYIPNDAVGSIIGKGGSRIEQIRQATGANVRISPSAPGEIQRTVTISGSYDSCQYAVSLIKHRVMEASVPTATDSSGRLA